LFPYLLFGSLGFGIAAIATALLVRFTHPLAAWGLAINLSALVVFRLDKTLAIANSLRVPEKVLLMLEAVGGTPGAAFAMWVIRPRHKTQSGGFLLQFFVILTIQLMLGLLILYSSPK
jgi:uncharacterized membrane protein YsdA (DUF1294 family)